jgi:hypothetical protein
MVADTGPSDAGTEPENPIVPPLKTSSPVATIMLFV